MVEEYKRASLIITSLSSDFRLFPYIYVLRQRQRVLPLPTSRVTSMPSPSVLPSRLPIPSPVAASKLPSRL